MCNQHYINIRSNFNAQTIQVQISSNLQLNITPRDKLTWSEESVHIDSQMRQKMSLLIQAPLLASRRNTIDPEVNTKKIFILLLSERLSKALAT